MEARVKLQTVLSYGSNSNNHSPKQTVDGTIAGQQITPNSTSSPSKKPSVTSASTAAAAIAIARTTASKMPSDAAVGHKRKRSEESTAITTNGTLSDEAQTGFFVSIF
jgi:hypothetical protein